MERYHFTLRFDDEIHSLTRFDGVSAQHVGELLISLSDALGSGKNRMLVLSEVRGNCYALELTTETLTVYETLKVIHKNISENKYQGLNTAQRKYALTLKSILGDRLYLRAYTKDKDYQVKVDKIELPPAPSYYFEIGTAYGIVTSIGGNTLEGKAFVKVNQEDYQIEITPKQEQQLLNAYKKNKLRLSIRKKINFETNKIMSAKLLDYEVLSEQSFLELAEKFREKHSQAFPNDVLLSVTTED